MDLEGYVGMLYVVLFTKGTLVTDAIGTCGSSLILILRTRAVWQRDTKISVVLGVLFLGQISLWIQSQALLRSMDIMSPYLVFSSFPVLKGTMGPTQKRMRSCLDRSQADPCRRVLIQLSLPAKPHPYGLTVVVHSDGI